MSAALHVVSLLIFFLPWIKVSACPGHEHDHQPRDIPNVQWRARANSPAPLTPPSRHLEWGDINVLHTTDSHGWLLGHQKKTFPEPNYSGDLGDFASFVMHMKEIALEKDVDLLLVDSGDLHDGTGLTDGYPRGGIDGHDANQFLKKLPYDVMAIGNHELYVYNNTLDMHVNFAPSLKGRYLSSNANITYVDDRGDVVNVPVGSRFAKFKTRKGRKITSFGVLFDFTGNANNTTVQKVEDMVKEDWFKDAIQDEPDLFLLVGHMPVAKDKWPLVFDAIRAIHPFVPIMIFGGHTHIRDCLQLDGRSMALESGRYMETIGWMSAKLDSKGTKNNISFSRRYLDPNRVTYEYHTRKSQRTFDTSFGRSITKGLLALAQRFNLNLRYGIAPRDYTLYQSPYPSPNSSLTLFIQHAAPFALSNSTTSTTNPRAVAGIPKFIITNSGSQRFDLYKGEFTRNDQFTVSPFKDTFWYIQDVQKGLAVRVLEVLNEGSESEQGVRRRGLPGLEVDAKREEEAYAKGHVDAIYQRWLHAMSHRGPSGAMKRDGQELTLGYVTNDACPGIGDDTPHIPLQYFEIPEFIGSEAPEVSDDTPIDFVFTKFIEAQVLAVLNALQADGDKGKAYTTRDVQEYSDVLANEVLGVYARAMWN